MQIWIVLETDRGCGPSVVGVFQSERRAREVADENGHCDVVESTLESEIFCIIEAIKYCAGHGETGVNFTIPQTSCWNVECIPAHPMFRDYEVAVQYMKDRKMSSNVYSIVRFNVM